ncbi:MAG: VanW family protein [Clostridia bacterium]|nr:VanW family protein [Clostridia bacterium]
MTNERYPQNRISGGTGSNARPRPASGAARRPAGGNRSRTTTGPRPAASARPGSAARPAAPGRTRGTAQSAARRPANGRQPVRQARPAAGGRRAPAPKRPGKGWRDIPAKLRLAICAAVLVLVIFGAVKLIAGAVANQEERFVDNVFVNGLSMGGYTLEEGYAAMEQLRDERLNTTYVLTHGGKSWNFTPSDFGASMDYESEMERAWNLGHVGDRAVRRQIIENLREVPAEFNSELTFDEAALETFIDGLAAEIHVDPVDAEVALTEEKPIITRASEHGWDLDQERTMENLQSLILTGEGDTQLPVDEVEPTVSSDNMEMKVVAKFSTDVSFRGADSRANVRLALSYFNCFALYPGETADFNAVVGPRTEARGFREAPEYAGNELKKGFGGGVCQASTTLYNAVIMANMTILERHNHNMTVAYVEPSQDAAVEYGTDGKNFLFRNDTEHAIYIYTNVDKENATVTIYGTRPEYHYELVSVIVSEQKSNRRRYEYDYEGRYVYYITDPPKLKQEGHGSCHSEGWVVAYDWDTKQEVSREQISYDDYVAGMNVYWKGVHDAQGNVVDPNATQEPG